MFIEPIIITNLFILMSVFVVLIFIYYYRDKFRHFDDKLNLFYLRGGTDNIALLPSMQLKKVWKVDDSEIIGEIDISVSCEKSDLCLKHVKELLDVSLEHDSICEKRSHRKHLNDAIG